MSGKKSVIVTGGGSGIGLAMSRHFASEGHSVAIFDVNQEAGAKIAGELSTEFPDSKITFQKCDVSSWQDQASAFKEVYEKRGTIDIVMANAGVSEQGSTTAIDLSEDEPTEPKLSAIKVNMIGVVYSEFSPGSGSLKES
jgi:NAD(P)-dependent dehydrogenase (short-subunit alcohol dehydrogenase family)